MNEICVLRINPDILNLKGVIVTNVSSLAVEIKSDFFF